MKMESSNKLSELLKNLPCQYQNIFNHPEFDSATLGIDTKKNAAYISELISQYKNLTHKKNVKVLDIGCAQGYYALTAAKNGCDVEAIDLEDANIALCNYLNKESSHNVKFRTGFFDLNFVKTIKEGEYDFIFLFNVIHHIACGCAYGYKGGRMQAKKIMNLLSTKCKILVGSLAVCGERAIWSKYLPQDYRDWLIDFKFYDEVRWQYINSSFQNIYRPVVLASNYYSIKDGILSDTIDRSVMTKYLCFSTSRKTMVVKKELLTKYPDLVVGHLKNLNYSPMFAAEAKEDMDYPFEKFNLSPNDKLYKNYNKIFKKNTLAVINSFKAGRIVQAIYKEKNNEVLITKKIIGTKDNCSGCYYRLFLGDAKRKYIPNAKLEIDLLLQLKDNEQAFLNEFEVYIAELFRTFKGKDSMLIGEAYDVTPINVLVTNDGKKHYIDFEFKLCSGIEKEYILYKNILYTLQYINSLDRLERYYNYFTNKFNLENKLNWVKFYEQKYMSFDCEMYKGYSWENYFNKFTFNFIKCVCRCIVAIIPMKKYRKKYRKNLINYLLYPNYRLARKYGIKDC